MSCFIVGEATMQTVVSAMHNRDLPREHADQLGRDLWLLNFRAWDTRYGKIPTTEADREMAAEWKWDGFDTPETDRYGMPWRDLAHSCEWLKALHCLRYQCTEGEAIQNTDLYKRLTERIHRLADAIVCSLPEYQAAPWGD